MTSGRGKRQAAVSVAWGAVTLVLALSVVAPLLYMLSVAMQPPAEAFSMEIIPKAPTLENCAHVFRELDFLKFLGNTLFVAGAVTFIALIFHSMAVLNFKLLTSKKLDPTLQYKAVVRP